MFDAATHAKLYKVQFQMPAGTLEEYETGKTLSPLHPTKEDKVAMKYGALLEAIFVNYPTRENALKWLNHIWPLVERYRPEDEDGSDFQTSGFIPTGRILVTQGRALPEFSEYWTSVSYSAYILQLDGGWDFNEYTGTVLRSAGLNGRGFPEEPEWGVVKTGDEILAEVGEEDLYGWDESMETVQL